MNIHKKSLFVAMLSTLPMLAYAQVESINLAKFNDQETITVFFDAPQTFKTDQLQNLFKVEKYDYDTWERKPDTQGKWHLSKDGYRLSYYPVGAGDYRIRSDEFKDKNNNEYSEYMYLGKDSEAVKIVGRGPVMPLSQGSLPLEMIGTEEVDIEYFKIDNLPKFLDQYYIGSNIDRWDLNRAVKDMTPEGIFRYKIPNDVPRETKSFHNVPVDKNIKSGAYIVTVSPAGQIDRTLDTRILFITDMGLHARLYPNETVIVGNYFSSGKPVDGAVIEAWRNEKGQLKITEDLCMFDYGICEIKQKLSRDDIVVAKYGNEVSILPLKEIALDLNDFAVDGKAYSDQVAYVYSNRELYRPGESVPVNIILRDQDGQALPQQPINIKLINPENKVVYENTLEATAEGFYTTYVYTSADDKTGRWRVEARTDATSAKPNGELTLFIEEFMPERMELTLSGVKDHYDMKDAIDLKVDSRYLFSAPAKNNDYTVQGKLIVNRTPFAAHKDWYVGKTAFPSEFMPDEIKYDQQLNAEGHADHPLSLGLEGPLAKNISAVLGLKADVTVLDGGTSGITRSFNTSFWPTQPVPVIRPMFGKDDLSYGSNAAFEIFTANMASNLGNAELKLTLRYKDDACTWVYNPNSGWDCHENYKYQIREQKVIKTSRDVVEYSMSPNSWGNYILEVEDLSSGMVTEYPFSAAWSNTPSGQLPAVKPNALALMTDKATYKTGETIKLTVDAPFAGNLTLMMEGSNLLYSKNLAVKQGKNSISIPMEKNWNRHDLYLSGLLLSKTKQDEVVRSLGLVPIHLNRLDRKLAPKLSFDAVALPDRKTTVKVEVPNASSKEQLYATVSVTDQGILNMIPVANESIFDAFFKHRKYQIDIIDYYNRLFKRGAYSMLVPKFGGDGEVQGNDSVGENITEMKTVSLMSSLIALDNKGRGEVTFDLPDFNGEAKVVVKVFSKDRVGEFDQQMTIRAPIVADIITPKFVRVGDDTNLSLSLHNMSGKNDDVKVTISSQQFDVKLDETVPLQDGEGTYRLVPLSLPTFTNFAEVELAIDSKDYQAKRTYRIGTDALSVKTTEYERNLLKAGQAWQQPASRTNYAKGFVENFTVSHHPFINVLSYTDGLFSYPYGCTEQTTSRAFPWLFKSNQLLNAEKKAVYTDYLKNKEMNRDVAPTMEYAAWEQEMMRDTVKRLLDRQRSDGGFAFWSTGESYFPSSVYALDFLTQLAKQDPTLVSQDHLKKGLEYVKNRLTETYKYHTNSGSYYLSESNLNNLSYGIWLLAREGQIFSADIAFMEQFDQTISPLSRVYLAGANLILSDQKAARQYLANLNFNGWQRGFGTYQTSVSALALSIDVLNQMAARGLLTDSSLAQKLNLDLANALNHKEYFSTQERYALIKVGMAAPADQTEVQLNMNDQSKTVLTNQPMLINDVQSIGANEDVFYEYQISGYPKQAVDSRKFNTKFDKSYWMNNTQNTVDVGDRFVVYLTIKSEKNLPNALLVDYIPTGFTLVNPNLLTDNVDEFYEQYNLTELTRSVLENEEYRFDRYVAAFNLQAGQEYRFAYILEAQVPGEYQMPVTILEDMYIPELRNLMVEPQVLKINAQK